ncbi:MAG: hypothetical protein J0I46_00060 [Thiobacillus sp.]|jgi:hypothetical protein|uniref:hypothetical protein n=1 Tax=unclassified Thiobacillus TaxID=2646513 RepID=UPI00086C8AED|nr:MULTISPECIES: hypothetical protein [unclassified Thiobacillus]MBN8769934.1 hypothetical protein [Thiobacillus sp.]MBN8778631.1 hypothetical protein [Thiobacillus sp.]MBS0328723.1 hypothetical protein [Pseudomonadota bacterium]ODV04787.1 MAG: hypothetical protein ABT23_00185 [Thiobacillus sp. SCN 63-57]
MRPCDLEKNREIVFHALPAGQAERALALLAGLEGLDVAIGADVYRLQVRYHICEYTLEGLETALASQGFHLDNSLLCKLRRALAYYCESVQRRNVAANEPDIKSQQAFMKVYERHLHGDCDETPEEWRSYK